MATSPNYVKFQRGTSASYNKLIKKDPNTLYFIYDSTTATTGSLYLGDKLISRNVGGDETISLSDLADVIVTGAHTGDFLVLNSEGKWIAASAATVAQTIMDISGNFITVDEKEFQFSAVNGKLELKGYATASNGLVPIKSTTGISWVSLPPDFSSVVSNLQTVMAASTTAITSLQNELQSVDGKINNAIINAGHISRKVITNLSAATAENVIYLYNNGTTVTNDYYIEYMVVDGQLEKIGDTRIDLSGYASTNELQAINGKLNNLNQTVNTLNSTVNTIGLNLNNYVLTTTFNAVVGDLSHVNSVWNNLTADDSISDTLNDIYERLSWQEISK